MRTALGSAALAVAGFLALGTVFVAVSKTAVDQWLPIASGCLAAVLGIAGIMLLHGRPSGRLGIVVPSFIAGLAGLVVAIASKYCGIEARGNQTYQLTVRAFGNELHQEKGPAVQRIEAGNTITGPTQDLYTKMTCWELGLDAATIAVGALLGGLLGFGIGHLRRPPVKGKRAIVD